LQEYACLLKSNFPTIDGARRPKHLFQMTVSTTHSINLAGLNQAMIELGLIGGAAPQECFLHFVVPTDVYPKYKHAAAAMVPPGSSLPQNVRLTVVEIPLPAQPDAAAAAAAGGGAGSKRKAEDADTIAPMAKKAVDTRCNCSTGCQTNICKCFKHGNKCGPTCHTAGPAAGTQCTNKAKAS
jgi:hypothetical protein